MNLRKYIREQISEGISNNDTEILIDKQALKKAVEQYVVENPEKDLVYVNDLGFRKDAYQILNFIMGNSSRHFLEKIAKLIGKDISDFEYEQKRYVSSLGKKSNIDINPTLYGKLDENAKEQLANFADYKTGRVPYEDLHDISNENDMDLDSDEFLNIYSSTSDEVASNFKQEFLQDMEWVRDEYFDGEYPNNFEEFYNEFKTQHFDNYYSKEEVKDKFEELTTDPNQLTLFEAKMPKTDYVKVIFEYDFTSGEERLRLIQLIKNGFFGQALDPQNPIIHREKDDKYLSTYIPQELLKKFLNDAIEFNPQPTSVVVKKYKFQPLKKKLNGGEKIRFFDYTISDMNPPISVGYLKPGYIQSYRSFLKWNDDGKEAWIDNTMIDDQYFYHGDILADKMNSEEGKTLDPKYVKIFFKDATIDKLLSNYVIDDMKVLDYEILPNDDKELKILKKFRSLILSYGGDFKYMFGKKRASGGQRYVSIPTNKADDFIDAVNNFSELDFGAGYGETERNIYLEDKALNEIRKIVRGVINKVIK